MTSEELIEQTISQRVDEILMVRESFEKELEDRQEYIIDLLEPDRRRQAEDLLSELELEKQEACAAVYREAFRDGLGYGSMIAERIMKKLI